MKLWNVKTPKFRKRGYTAAGALSLCLFFCFGMVRAGAQLRTQKRITSVWTATGAEGSRVTVASDGQLNDYEAYTRGNRFYVKIPSADLPSTTGSLLGRGFDDVQIQRAGDGIILSFRLQPGTTARVDHKLNRIEVVFLIPVRAQSSASSGDRNDVANRTRARTIHDSVGPTPPLSTTENQNGPGSFNRHAERGERAFGSDRRSNSRAAREARRSAAKSSASESNRQKSLREKASTSSLPQAGSTASSKQPPASESPTPGNSSQSNGSSTKGPAPSASPLPSASPIHSTSPVASSLAAASPSGSPLYAAPATQQTSAGASPTPVYTSAGTSDWSSRLHYYKTWARLNPLPLALWIGGLTFLALMLLLLVRRRRKRRGVHRAERGERHTPPETGPSADPKPVMTDPAGAGSGQSRVQLPSKNSISAPAAGKDAHAGEDPEREVFEL